MFQIDDDMTLYITRGDVGYFSVTADSNGKLYKFSKGDVVRIKVTKKKDCASVVLQKDFAITEDTEKVNILLTEEDTKIGDVISKPVDYWYEIELNPYTNPQTIIGYDDDGAKILKLFPEGKDVNGTGVAEKDIPVIDAELSLTSERPVENRVVTRAMVKLAEDLKSRSTANTEAITNMKKEVDEHIDKFGNEVSLGIARLNNLTTGGGMKTRVIEIETNTVAGGTVESVTITTDFETARLEIIGLLGTFDEAILAEVPSELIPKSNAGKISFGVDDGGYNGGYFVNLSCETGELTVDGTLDSTDNEIVINYDLKTPYIPELVDARTGHDGKIYGTAGEAVRKQFSEMNRINTMRADSLLAVFSKLVFKEPLTNAELDNFLNSWKDEPDAPDIPYPLADGIHTFSDGTEVTVTNGKHVEIIFKADVENATIVLSNVKENGPELTNSNALNPESTWFILNENDDVKIRYGNFDFSTLAANVAIGLKKKGTADSVSGLSITYPTTAVEQTMTEGANVGNMFLYVSGAKAGDTLRFDVSITVNGNQYV